MNILVTGSNGRIGRYVVEELLLHGHTVVGMDVSPAVSRDRTTIQGDLTNAGEVYQILSRSGAEAVVHMGAWANAGLVADHRTYADNVTGSFNLFQACADLGIKRVVSASSNHVYGLSAAPPLYAPVDELHPFRPANCYGLSKIAGEQAAAYFNDRYGMEIFSFRLLGVRAPSEIPSEIEAMAQNPASGASLLWTRTDARDAAAACRLAVEATSVSPGPYNITGAEVVLPQKTSELVERHFGVATEIRSEFHGHESPLSIAKAREAFGYEPQYTWRVEQYFLEDETSL